jgi:2-polyprenyl-3-methyl-5-hydroxy-6-metoxy-1,4-benzoquinol methylase
LVRNRWLIASGLLGPVVAYAVDHPAMNSPVYSPQLAPARSSLWDLSALVYKRTYDAAAHLIDEYVIETIADGILGGVVVDAGCGPGVVVPRFLASGARRVIAVDLSDAMLGQVLNHASVTKVAANLQPGAFAALRRDHEPRGFDLIWFKRSLYHDDATALELLRDAYESLSPRGRIVVIHPESSLWRYIFDDRGDELRLASYTAYHAFNRAISETLRALGLHTYRHRTAAELLALGTTAASQARVSLLDSHVSAFNTLLIERREQP